MTAHADRTPPAGGVPAPATGDYLYTITCCEDVDIFMGVEARCGGCGSTFLADGTAGAPQPIGDAS